MNTPFEKRICYTVCICQMTAVLSCVSLVYLTVAVYYPSYATLRSGFSEDTVMCTTVRKEMPSCEPDEEERLGLDVARNMKEDELTVWTSCSEWCLSKSSTGICTQLRVDVRYNGSNLWLEECEPADVKYCDGINPKMLSKSCILGECADLHGIYNCSKGPASPTGGPGSGTAMCRNLTSVLSCTLTTTDTPKECNTKAGCKDLEGLYFCEYGICKKILPPYKCEKRCVSIITAEKTVLIRQNDVIYTVKCGRAVAADTKQEVWPLGKTDLQAPNKEPPFLIMFCTNVVEMANDTSKLYLTDCFNGTLLDYNKFGNYTDINAILRTHLEATEAGNRLMDPAQVYAPLEQTLLIMNNTMLKINFEGCVNTLGDECERFHQTYGGDGLDMRSNSRFQCYYTPNDTTPYDERRFVLLRFSLAKTMFELLIAACVPVTLAIVSCTTLVICSRIIHVGDDSHLNFICSATAKETMEKEALSAIAL